MKFVNRVLLTVAFSLSMLAASGRAQTKTPTIETKTSALPADDAQERNVQAYIDLLRRDVRQQKAEIMGAVMVLTADDAAKF